MSSCKKQSDINQIAKEFCTCMKPVVDIYDKSQSLSSEDDLDKISAAIEEIEKAVRASEECAKEIDSKYGNLDEREQELQAAMQSACPDVMQKMNEIDTAE